MRTKQLATLLGMALVPALAAAPALAVAPIHVYVSAVSGADSGDCSNIAAPCLTLNYAQGQVASTGGLISIVGGGDFTPLTITKGVTIQAVDVPARIVGDGVAAASIIVNAGTTDTVTLKGLGIVGGTVGAVGIQINTAGKVYILKSTVRGFTPAPGNAIVFAPANGGGNSQLYVSDVEVSNSTGGLISVRPADSTVAKVFFNRVEVHHGLFGIRTDGTNAAVDTAIRDSAFFSFNNAGITAVSSTNLVRVSYDKSTILNAGTAAINASGNKAHIALFDSVIEGSNIGINAVSGGGIIMDNNVITGNGTGVFIDTGAGSFVQSCGNNMVKFNGSADAVGGGGAISAGCNLQ